MTAIFRIGRQAECTWSSDESDWNKNGVVARWDILAVEDLDVMAELNPNP